MTTQHSRQAVASLHAGFSRTGSSLVRRLVLARDDPAKQRIRTWLVGLDDSRLSDFGLTPQDIDLLRGKTRAKLPSAA